MRWSTNYELQCSNKEVIAQNPLIIFRIGMGDFQVCFKIETLLSYGVLRSYAWNDVRIENVLRIENI